jgi:hypothetical protein
MCNESNVTRLIEAYFPEDGTGRVRNVKVCSGRGHHVTAEQIAGEILSADEQIRTGRARRVDNIDGDLCAR